MTSALTTSRPRPGPPLSVGDQPSLADRMPPHDLTAEKCMLGSMLISRDAIGQVLSLVRDPVACFNEENQKIFKVLITLYEKNIPIDEAILESSCLSAGILDEIGGVAYLAELANAVPSAASAVFYAATVKEKWTLRQQIAAYTAGLRDCYESTDPADVVLDRGQARIFKIADGATLMRRAVSIGESLHATVEAMDRSGGEHLTGIGTGYIELDNLTSGMQKGEMAILAARPSVGKTALMLNIVEHVGVDLRKPCVVFSLEMSKLQLNQRILCSRSGVDSHKMRRGMLSHQDRERIAYAVGNLSAAPIYVDDSPRLSLLELRTQARKYKAELGIEFIALDYLQLMEQAGRQENRQTEIASISRGIKALARELDVPVLCLSQLNRGSESEQRLPRISDLRESGAIEQDADVIMLLHREAVMRRGDQEWRDANPDKINEALLILAKQRNGPCDVVKMTFFDGQTRFVNYNPGV